MHHCRPRLGLWAATVSMLFAITSSTALAQYTVGSGSDDGSGAAGTLSAAIDAANAAAAANNGPPATYTINFDPTSPGLSGPNPTITLNGNLPPILCNLVINGAAVGGLTINGANQYAAFFVESGNVKIENLSIANTNAVGGAGGNTGTYAGGGGGGLGAGGAAVRQQRG